MEEKANSEWIPWLRRIRIWSERSLTLNWIGFTREGVSKFSGNADVPPTGTHRFLWGLAAVETAFALVIAIGKGNLYGAGGLLLAAAIHGLVGLWAYRFQQRVQSLVPAEEVGPLLRMTEDEARALLEEKGIRPRYEINGRPFYDGAAFGEVATLLRAARPNEDPRQLLRPASSVESDPDALVRPVAASVKKSAGAPSRDYAETKSAEELRTTNQL